MKIRSLWFVICSTKGYTLVEMLVVASVLVTVGGLVASVLYSTIRGSNKTKITNSVAQNGNHATSVISSFIVNANEFVSFERTNGNVRTDCVTSTRFKGKAVTIVAADTGPIEFRCSDTGDEDRVITSNSASLIDNSQVQIARDTCFIYCHQADLYSPPRIDIEFELEPLGESEFVDLQAEATFKTSASFRNFHPR